MRTLKIRILAIFLLMGILLFGIWQASSLASTYGDLRPCPEAFIPDR